MTGPSRSARSLAEASLWAQLDTCVCGGLGVDWVVTRLEVHDEDTTAVQMQSACGNCGRLRGLTFRVPAGRPEPPDHHFAHTGDGPSELYDAAEWWAFADRYDAVADELIGSTGNVPAADRARAVGFLTQAATAMDEVLRFLPDGAGRLPDEAFRTPWSRETAAARPELFTRVALEGNHARRWVRRNEFVAQLDRPIGGESIAAAAVNGSEQAYPFARTADEELLYLRLHPCACGEPDFEPERGVDHAADGATIGWYRGRCTACGRTRQFVFREPPDMPIPDGEHWASVVEPSELIDPGEWWLIAQALANEIDDRQLAAAPAELRSALLHCAAALSEVLKFIPDGADAVPPDAFKSHRGRAEWLRSRLSFDRDVLEVRQRYFVQRADTLPS